MGLRFMRLPLRRFFCYSAVQGPPVRVEHTPNAGRGAFATRKLAFGELLYSAKPAITHPSMESLGKVCSICLRRQQSNASWKSYCSQACKDQAEGFCDIEASPHWSDFHNYCRQSSIKFPLMVKRLTCMIAGNVVSPDALDILYPPCPPDNVPDKWIKERMLIIDTLSRIGVPNSAMEYLTDSWYAASLTRVHLNTFRVETISMDGLQDLRTAAVESVTGDDSVGSAIYILPSMFNHSCDPNVNIFWPENAFARLETLREIEADEELTITYIDANMAFHKRQNLLKQAYGFSCQCRRCLDKD